MPTAPDSRSDTRTRILDAARELFHRDGYHSASLAAICEAADARPGSLYHFFKMKEALLVGVLERYQELLEPVVLQPAWAAVEDPIARVFALLAGYRRMLVMTDCAAGCPIGNLALQLAEPSPEVRRGLSDNFALWSQAVERCLDAAGDRLPPELDRRRLSRFVLTVMEGGVLLARGSRSLEPFDDAVAQLRDYFERLTGEPVPEIPPAADAAPPIPSPPDPRPPEA